MKIKSTKLKAFLKFIERLPANTIDERHYGYYRDFLDDLYVYGFIGDSDYFSACAILRARKINEVK